MIIRNAVRCKYCGKEIESTSCLRSVTCPCGRCTISGGHRKLTRDCLTLSWGKEMSQEDATPDTFDEVGANWKVPVMHKLIEVTPLSNFRLLAVFSCSTVVLYDVKRLFDRYKGFRDLASEPDIFRKVMIGPDGHGVYWNDFLDLSSDEIWNNGQETTTIEGEYWP